MNKAKKGPTKPAMPRRSKEPPIADPPGGVETDPFEQDQGEQILKRRDTTLYTVDASQCNTRSVLNSSKDSGGKSHRLTWLTPLAYSENAGGTDPKDDYRGLVTDVYGGVITFRNLSNQEVRVKCNCPKSHILLANIHKIAARDGDVDLLIKPHGIARYKYSFKQNSTAMIPAFTKVQISDGAKYYPYMILVDYAIIIPDVNEDTGVAFTDKEEMVEVTLSHSYSAVAGFTPGVGQTKRSSFALTLNDDLKSMYKVDAAQATTNETGVTVPRAPVNGYKMVTVDAVGHHAIGFKLYDGAWHDGNPNEPLEGSSLKDIDSTYLYKVQLAVFVRRGNKVLNMPAEISGYQSPDAILITPFGPISPIGGSNVQSSCWKYDRIDRCFVAWDFNKDQPCYSSEQWTTQAQWPKDCPITAYKSDYQLQDVHISFTAVLAILEAASAIVGIVQKLTKKVK